MLKSIEMEKEFYIHLAEPDADGVFFSDQAIREAARQIKGLPVKSDSEQDRVIGTVKEAEVGDDSAIRISADFIAGYEIPKTESERLAI